MTYETMGEANDEAIKQGWYTIMPAGIHQCPECITTMRTPLEHLKDNHNVPAIAAGLSKRDYFIAMAMQARIPMLGSKNLDSIIVLNEFATDVIKIADAILQRIEK